MATKSKPGLVAAEADWQVESDLRTIECEIIEKDPKRLAAVQALAKKKMLSMATIASEGKDNS